MNCEELKKTTGAPGSEKQSPQPPVVRVVKTVLLQMLCRDLVQLVRCEASRDALQIVDMRSKHHSYKNTFRTICFLMVQGPWVKFCFAPLNHHNCCFFEGL